MDNLMTVSSAAYSFIVASPAHACSAHQQPVVQLNSAAGPPVKMKNMHMLEIVLSGELLIRDHRTVISADRQLVLLVSAGKRIREATADYRVLQIGFDAQYLQHCLLSLLPADHTKMNEGTGIVVFPRPDTIKADLESILTNLSSAQPNTALMTRHLGQALLLKILLDNPANDLTAFLPESGLAEKADISYFLEANFTRKLTVKELAATAGKSPSAFKRDFAGSYAMPPVQWLIGRRLDYAYFLIRNTNYSISTIALLCGFGVLSYFSASYKEKFGCSPLQSKLKGIF